MSHPTLSPALLISPLENGYIAYDPKTDQLHELNPLAALIVELCDGTRTPEEIAGLVAPLLPEGRAAEVAPWIASAIQSGVLLPGPPAEETHRELSSEDLCKLAGRLRDNGKIQTAFLCQRRATEMDPGDPGKWHELGELAHILGRREDARAAYERYLELDPDDAEVQLLLVALRDQAPPPRVPDQALHQLYQKFSKFFENNLVNDLDYCGPERLQGLVDEVLGERKNLAMLELGCGTGLAGARFKPSTSRMTGVDISPEMVELARARHIYDELHIGEITDWLRRCHDQFDLIVACDTLIYFGDLEEVMSAIARLLRRGGVFGFTVERGDHHPFRLSDAGRYTHDPRYIREVATQAGLGIARMEEAFLRMEYGNEVTAIYAVLHHAGLEIG